MNWVFFYIYRIFQLYNTRDLRYDIALLKLAVNVTYVCNDYVQPICLAEPEQSFDYAVACYAIGWGATGKTELNKKK